MQLFQLVIGFIFGWLIDLNMALTSGLECTTLTSQLLTQLAGCTIMGIGIAFEVRCRFGNHAGRRNFDRHQSGDAPSVRKSQDRSGYDPRTARRGELLSVFRKLAMECHRCRNAFRDDLCRTRD